LPESPRAKMPSLRLISKHSPANAPGGCCKVVSQSDSEPKRRPRAFVLRPLWRGSAGVSFPGSPRRFRSSSVSSDSASESCFAKAFSLKLDPRPPQASRGRVSSRRRGNGAPGWITQRARSRLERTSLRGAHRRTKASRPCPNHDRSLVLEALREVMLVRRPP
jgi:hypothetical protein